MSIAQPQIDRRPSPGAFAPTNPFASNNPFRNRVSASSPDLPSPSIRQSRNPFLDVFADDDHDIFSSETDNRSANTVQATSPRPPQPQVPRNEPDDLLVRFE
ncbi:hypothetical protein TWF706_003303 [Orbilia oligospora]|nr:hypothetical protein TWF706_003303 [Orbilia oligospora]